MQNNKSSLNFIEVIAANETPATVINSAPIEAQKSYFRSRTFTSHIACNSLVAAANALLACNHELKNLTEFENLEQLHADLLHEIHAFESNAKEHGYSSETIIIARYILCATLDETIIFGKLKNKSIWECCKLINNFQNETSTDERFFLLVQRLLNDPITHLNLLELAFHCLSSGYQGKYRHEENGLQSLQIFIDNLYQQIRFLRKDAPRLPLPTLKKNLTNKNKTHESKNVKIPLWPTLLKSGCITFCSAALIYSSLTFMYSQISNPVKQQITHLMQTNL